MTDNITPGNADNEFFEEDEDVDELLGSYEDGDPVITEAPLRVEDVLNRSFEQMVLFEKRLDAQEELIANMMLAYSEITTTLEMIISEVMAPRSEQEKREFKSEMKKRHMNLLQAIQEASRGMVPGGPDLGAAVENLVREDNSSPTES